MVNSLFLLFSICFRHVQEGYEMDTNENRQTTEIRFNIWTGKNHHFQPATFPGYNSICRFKTTKTHFQRGNLPACWNFAECIPRKLVTASRVVWPAMVEQKKTPFRLTNVETISYSEFRFEMDRLL